MIFIYRIGFKFMVNVLISKLVLYAVKNYPSRRCQRLRLRRRNKDNRYKVLDDYYYYAIEFIKRMEWRNEGMNGMEWRKEWGRILLYITALYTHAVVSVNGIKFRFHVPDGVCCGFCAPRARPWNNIYFIYFYKAMFHFYCHHFIFHNFIILFSIYHRNGLIMFCLFCRRIRGRMDINFHQFHDADWLWIGMIFHACAFSFPKMRKTLIFACRFTIWNILFKTSEHFLFKTFAQFFFRMPMSSFLRKKSKSYFSIYLLSERDEGIAGSREYGRREQKCSAMQHVCAAKEREEKRRGRGILYGIYTQVKNIYDFVITIIIFMRAAKRFCRCLFWAII